MLPVSPRLRYVPVGPEHRDAVHALWNDVDVARYLFDGEPVSMETVDGWIATSQQTMGEGGYGIYLLHRADTGEEVGFAGLVHLLYADELELVAGLWPRAWGQGYATESGLACMRLGFVHVGRQALVAGTDPPNAASLRLMDRLGFRPWRETVLHGLPVIVRRLDRAGWDQDEAARG